MAIKETNVQILLSVNQLLVSSVSTSLILLLRSDDEKIATDITLVAISIEPTLKKHCINVYLE